MDNTLSQLTKGSGRKGGKKGKKPRRPRINGPAKTKAAKQRRTAKAKQGAISKWRTLDGLKAGLGRIMRAAMREDKRQVPK